MARDFAAAGLEVVAVGSLAEGEERARQEAEGALVTLDSVLCSPTVIRRFVKAARARPGSVALVCALPRAVGTDYLSLVEGLEARETPAAATAVAAAASPGTAAAAMGTPGKTVWTVPLFFVRGTGALAAAEPTVQTYNETLLRFPIPFGILGREGEELLVGLSESYMCSVSHWVHVLRINSAAMAGWWVKRLRLGYVLGAFWLFWRFLCGFPWWGGRLFGAIRGVSWGAKVHHTAVAELSIVKKGAIVGANASLKNCFVDEGATIGEGARVSGCVIGKGALVAPNSIVNLSVVYPGAMAGQLLMQASVLGKNSAAFTNSCFYDLNFSRNIRVVHKGRVVDSGTQMLGVCVGPEARVAAGIWVASGREVPAGALLIKPPGEVATNMGRPARGEPHVVVEGDVVPLPAAKKP